MPSPRAAKYLPDDWETVSARGLFAILKPRDLNPVDYDKKIEFWSNLIAKYCHVSKTAMADFSILRQKFRRGNLLPSPLDGVMQEMHRNGTLQTMEEFQRKQGWLSWGMSLISGPSQIDFTKTVVAHIPTVKILAKDIKQFQQELANEYDDYPEVIAFDELKERCRHIVADDFSFEFVIQQLIKWGDVSEGISKSGDRVLKFSEKNNGNARFTETDASIHDIRRAMTKIENEIKRLENKEKELKEEAKKTLHNRNKTGALKILRRKKTVEKEIEMKDNQYRQLLEMLQQIASTRQTKEVLDAYKAGNKAFKDALGRQGLTVENIDQTIDSINDVFQAAKDVEDAVSTGFRSNTQIIDDDEVEAELEEMIEADKVAEQNNRVKVNKNIINIGNLPEVPTNNISIDDSLEQRMRRLREMA